MKEILYRPPKVKALYDKYWQLAKVVDGRIKQEHDYEILKENRAKYPKKTAEELQYLDRIISKVEEMINEDVRGAKEETAATTQL